MPSPNAIPTTDRTTVLRSSFNGGLISPLMLGRADFAKYKDSCTELKNFIPWVTGAVKKRAGSIYVRSCKYVGSETRLISFRYSDKTNYIIEFGHKYFRFYANGESVFIYDAVSGRNISYEITHSFDARHVFEFAISQVGDNVFFVNTRYPPHKLVRIAGNNWSFASIPISGLNPDLPGNPGKLNWGNPGAICFFENRLWLAGSNLNPRGLAASKTGDYFNFNITGEVKDDSSLRFTINSSNNHQIKWLHSGRDMIIGTSGDEYIMTGGTTGITPTNVSVRTYTSYGSTVVAPIQIDDRLSFVQTGGTVVREFSYAYDSDAYRASDATVLTEHITHSGIKEMAYQQQPNKTLWLLLNDGRMAGMVRNEDHKIQAWFEVETSDPKLTYPPLRAQGEDETDAEYSQYVKDYNYYSTFGFGYKSIAVIPDWNDSREDIVWNVVTRMVGNRIVQAIEYTPSYGYDKHAVFTDSSAKYDGEPTSAIKGMNHLEGEMVAIYADGNVVPNQKVIDGRLHFGKDKYSTIIMGLPYESILTTTPLEFGEITSIVQGSKSKIISCIFRLDRTAYEISYSWDNNGIHLWNTEVFKVVGDTVLGQSDKLFTGDTDNLRLSGSSQTSLQMSVRHNKPAPFTLLAMMITVQVTSI